jgi:hypothetical protein
VPLPLHIRTILDADEPRVEGLVNQKVEAAELEARVGVPLLQVESDAPESYLDRSRHPRPRLAMAGPLREEVLAAYHP